MHRNGNLVVHPLYIVYSQLSVMDHVAMNSDENVAVTAVACFLQYHSIGAWLIDEVETTSHSTSCN